MSENFIFFKCVFIKENLVPILFFFQNLEGKIVQERFTSKDFRMGIFF